MNGENANNTNNGTILGEDGKPLASTPESRMKHYADEAKQACADAQAAAKKAAVPMIIGAAIGAGAVIVGQMVFRAIGKNRGATVSTSTPASVVIK